MQADPNDADTHGDTVRATPASVDRQYSPVTAGRGEAASPSPGPSEGPAAAPPPEPRARPGLHGFAVQGQGIGAPPADERSTSTIAEAPDDLATKRAQAPLGGMDSNALSESEAMTAVAIDPESAAARDWLIVRWVARMGAVTLGQIQDRFGLGRSVAYERTATAIRRGQLERVSLLRGQPALLRATRKGLRLTGTGLGLAQIAPDQFGHWIACSQVAIALEREFGQAAVLIEREIRAAELSAGKPMASAVLGERLGGPILHRADLAVLLSGDVLAIEVELTPKSPRRLEAIIRAWRRTRSLAGIRYYVGNDKTRRAVERAIRTVHAAERVEVIRLGRDLKPLVAGYRREGPGETR